MSDLLLMFSVVIVDMRFGNTISLIFGPFNVGVVGMVNTPPFFFIQPSIGCTTRRFRYQEDQNQS